MVVMFSPFWLDHSVFMRPCATFDRGCSDCWGHVTPNGYPTIGGTNGGANTGIIDDVGHHPAAFLNPLTL